MSKKCFRACHNPPGRLLFLEYHLWQGEQQMTVFVATSKRFYGEAQEIVKKLEDAGVKVHHPYFHLDPAKIDADADLKSRVTIQHFPEIDESDIFYALLPGGYIGCSVTIELTYAYARGKKIVASEAPQEFAVRAMVSETCRPQQFIARFA
jgi:hypothetical protein